MKKLFIVAIICLLSFSKKSNTYHWFTYIGSDSPIEMYDPNNYYMTEETFPECPNINGSVYCSIYTTIDPNSPFGNPLPDMAGIIARRYRDY